VNNIIDYKVLLNNLLYQKNPKRKMISKLSDWEINEALKLHINKNNERRYGSFYGES
jgi:hypothetical protein